MSSTSTSTSTTIVKLTPEEIKLRGTLLARNKDLLKLHKELVFSGCISEEEFWEDRRGLLRSQEVILKQKKGLSSNLISDDLKPVSSAASSLSSTAPDVKYVLTPAIIQTIFEQHPILRKAFDDLVNIATATINEPLTERDFWIEYFKSKFFNETGTQRSGATGSNLLDKYFEEDLKKSLTEQGADMNDEDMNISGMVDISRSREDHISDYLRDENEIVSGDATWKTLSHFNKHSMRILKSTSTNKSSSTTASKISNEYIEIPDLQTTNEPQLAPFNVQEFQLFNFNKTEEKIKQILTPDWRERIVSTLADLNRTSVPMTTSHFISDYKIHQTSFNQILQQNHFTTTLNDSKSSTDLPDDISDLTNSTVEILRHFWKSVSIPNVTDRTAKMTRMFVVLERLEQKILGLIAQSQQNHKYFLNLMETIGKARCKYNEIINISTK